MLRDRLNPGGPPAQPLYVLDVQLKESIEQLAIRKDETATRANLRLSAEYKLRQRDTNEVVTSGLSLTTTTYNILNSQFATYTSEEDARKRALRELSDDIRIQLGAYFHRLRNGTT
jgi:LPS-assembly lipoprotein